MPSHITKCTCNDTALGVHSKGDLAEAIRGLMAGRKGRGPPSPGPSLPNSVGCRTPLVMCSVGSQSHRPPSSLGGTVSMRPSTPPSMDQETALPSACPFVPVYIRIFGVSASPRWIAFKRQ
jgi:hypothetical protein